MSNSISSSGFRPASPCWVRTSEHPDFGVRDGLSPATAEHLGELREDVFQALRTHDGSAELVRDLTRLYQRMPVIRNGSYQMEPAQATCNDVARALEVADLQARHRPDPGPEKVAHFLEEAQLGVRERLRNEDASELSERRRILANNLATDHDRAPAFLALQETYDRLGSIHNGDRTLTPKEALLSDLTRLLAVTG